jgi:hypothetical protein
MKMNTQNFPYVPSTTQGGLLGILDSGSIWATKIQFMNDATEFRMALDTVAEEIRSRRDDLEERARVEAIFSEFSAIEETNVFVLSLTEKGDDLSQWRAYGGRHSGFALGFDIERLCSLASEHTFSLERCIYDSAAHSLLAATIVDSAFAWPSTGARMTQRRCREFRRQVVKTAPLLKHYSFEEEREWRLVSTSHPITSPKIGFRAGPSTIIPHYCLPLRGKDDSSPLSSVIVGPTPHPELAIESVQAFLQARGFSDVFAHQSQIPLRTW